MDSLFGLERLGLQPVKAVTLILWISKGGGYIKTMHRVYRALLGENPFLFLSFALIAWCTSRRLLSMAPRQRISSNLLLSARTIVLFLFLGAVWVCWKVFVMLSFKRWSMIDYYIMQFFSTVCALVLLRACCFGCLGGAFFSPTEREGRADYSIQSISFDS